MSKNDIGFVLIKLTNSAFYDKILETIQKFISYNPFDQIVIFNSYCDKLDTKNIPILHISHSQFFNGKLVMFDLASVMISQKFTNVNSRYLYVQDIPWMNSPKSNYAEWLNLYSSPNLNLIASDSTLYDIYSLT